MVLSSKMPKRKLNFDAEFIESSRIVKKVTVEKDKIFIVTSKFKLMDYTKFTPVMDKYWCGPYRIEIPIRKGTEGPMSWFSKVYIGLNIDFGKLFMYMHKNKIRYIPDTLRYPHPHILAGVSVAQCWESIHQFCNRKRAIPEEFLKDQLDTMFSRPISICFGGYKQQIWNTIKNKNYTEVSILILSFLQSYAPDASYRRTTSLATCINAGLHNKKEFKL